MKSIPKELSDQGVRWVEVRDYHSHSWRKRILLAVLPEGADDRYVCVMDCGEDDFLEGKEFPTVAWKQVREIKQPKDEATDIIEAAKRQGAIEVLEELLGKLHLTESTDPDWDKEYIILPFDVQQKLDSLKDS